MDGKELNLLLGIGAKHALYREDGKWFHHLKEFPGVLFDKSGFLIVENEIEYINNPNFQHGVDLHVRNGISNIRGYKLFNFQNISSIAIKTKIIDEDLVRTIREINSINRNAHYVKVIKIIYENTCQLCNTKLTINNNVNYSEVHHIKPLGNPHHGPDKLENMICVCPNHHVLLDFGAIKLDIDSFQTIKHKINNSFINYHNNEIHQKPARRKI